MFKSLGILFAMVLLPLSGSKAGLLSAACALILLCVQLLAVRCITRRRRALLASLLLLSSPLFLSVAHLEVPDLPPAMFLSSAMLLFAVVLIKDVRWLLPFAYLCSAAVAVAIGPLALMTIMSCLVAYCGIRSKTVRQFWMSIIGLRLPEGLILIAMALLPGWMQNSGPVAPLSNPPWWFAALCLVLGCMPWTFFAGGAARMTYKLLTDRAHLTAGSQLVLFAGTWLITTMVTLALNPHESVTYLLSASPAFAIIVASVIDVLLRCKKLAILWVPAAFLTLMGLSYISVIVKTTPSIADAHVFSLLFAIGATILAMLFTVMGQIGKAPRAALWHMVTCTVIGFGAIVPLTILFLK